MVGVVSRRLAAAGSVVNIVVDAIVVVCVTGLTKLALHLIGLNGN